MNRSGRTRVNNAVRDCDRKIRQALYVFNNEIESIKDEENEKLDNLPQQIRDSTLGENFTEALQMLDELIETSGDIETSLDELIDTAGVQSDFTVELKTKKISDGRKGINFHAIIPSALMEKLRGESLLAGLSMNEILCRALLSELEEKPKMLQRTSKMA